MRWLVTWFGQQVRSWSVQGAQIRRRLAHFYVRIAAGPFLVSHSVGLWRQLSMSHPVQRSRYGLFKRISNRRRSGTEPLPSGHSLVPRRGTRLQTAFLDLVEAARRLGQAGRLPSIVLASGWSRCSRVTHLLYCAFSICCGTSTERRM